ncbi:hypothetical protein DFH06DRAFT_1210928, partial [Mycena polygramma]
MFRPRSTNASLCSDALGAEDLRRRIQLHQDSSTRRNVGSGQKQLPTDAGFPSTIRRSYMSRRICSGISCVRWRCQFSPRFSEGVMVRARGYTVKVFTRFKIPRVNVGLLDHDNPVLRKNQGPRSSSVYRFMCQVVYCGASCQKTDWKRHKAGMHFRSFPILHHSLMSCMLQIATSEQCSRTSSKIKPRTPKSA